MECLQKVSKRALSALAVCSVLLRFYSFDICSFLFRFLFPFLDQPQNMSDHASHTCSAPGKVLLAGGYLVLDRPNIGITIATTSKFHTMTEWDSKKHQKDDNDEHATLQSLAITVVSPQFGTTNVYNVLPPGKEDGSTPYVVLTDVTGNETPRNKFVETC